MQHILGSDWSKPSAKRTLLFALCSAYCLTSSALAENGFRPPASVFVLDSRTQTIRPVVGRPGAWIADQGLDLGMPVLAARFSVERDFALILAGGADTPAVAVVTGLKNGPVSVTPIQGALGSANVLVLNDAGTAGLLYSEANHQVQFLGGLPGSPSVLRTVAVDQLPGQLTALALNSGGDLALLAVANDSSGSVYRLSPDNGPEFVTSVQRASSIAFESDQSAFVADADAGQILRIDARSGGGAALVADSSRGIQQPQSLQVLSGTRILVGQAQDSSIRCLDLSSGLDALTIIPASPTSMDRFPGSYFVLNQPGSGPVYVLETGPSTETDCTQKIWFIPAD